MASVNQSTAQQLTTWWTALEPQWQRAFNEAILGKGATTAIPSAEEMELLQTSPALRFTGPRAPYPNMSFELTNLSGLAGFTQVETLVLTHQSLRSVEALAPLKQLKHLFVNNNLIRSLDGVQALRKLEMLYAQCNEITSSEPVRKLTALRELYLNHNQLTELTGLTANHARAMEALYVLPNPELPDREVLRIEREAGIRCRKAG